jgi:hypothetical protein
MGDFFFAAPPSAPDLTKPIVAQAVPTYWIGPR